MAPGGYLLDTTVLVDHVRNLFGAPHALIELFEETGDLYVCDAVVAEALSKGDADELRAIDTLIDAFEYVSTPPGAARRAGAIHRDTSRHSPRHLGDALLAGLALEMGATVVTRNPRDFQRLGVPVRAYGQTPA